MKAPTGTGRGSITAVVGAILAGGAGRRMGGAKPARELAGRPLMAYPAAALAAVCELVAVVSQPGLELPDGPWVPWGDEPAEPRHPAAGIAHALRRAGGPGLVCAAGLAVVGAREGPRAERTERGGGRAR